jgi:hypothetical protein
MQQDSTPEVSQLQQFTSSSPYAFEESTAIENLISGAN